MTFTFKNIDNTIDLGPFTVRPKFYPVSNNGAIITGDTVQTGSLNNVYVVKTKDIVSPDVWYVSGSHPNAADNVLAGVAVTGSVSATTFDFQDCDFNNLTATFDIRPVYRGVTYGGAFVKSTPLSFKASEFLNGALTVNLIPQPYVINFYSDQLLKDVIIYPSGSACNAGDVLVDALTITAMTSSVIYSAGRPNSISSSYSNTASNAITASYVDTARTASFVTASNVVGTINSSSYASYASNTGPANIIYASRIGCALNSNLVTGGGTDDTLKLQSALNTLHTLGGGELIIDGVALISSASMDWSPSSQYSALEVYANTTIRCLSGCGVYLADNSNCTMLGNHPTGSVDTTTWNGNIKIIGGVWNGNFNNQARHEKDNGGLLNGVDYNMLTVGFWFGGFDGVLLENVEVRDAKVFATVFSNGTNLTVRNCKTFWTDTSDQQDGIGGNNWDGLHFWGDLTNVFIDGFYHNGDDDGLAFNTDEGVHTIRDVIPNCFGKGRFPSQCITGITNVTANNVFFDSSSNTVAFYNFGVGSGIVNNVNFNNIYGTVTYLPMHNGFGGNAATLLNVSAFNYNVAGDRIVSGVSSLSTVNGGLVANVVTSSFCGNGSQLTGIKAGSIVGTIPSASFATTASYAQTTSVLSNPSASVDNNGNISCVAITASNGVVVGGYSAGVNAPSACQVGNNISSLNTVDGGVQLGFFAGYSSSFGDAAIARRTVQIGSHVGFRSKSCPFSVMVGYGAGYTASVAQSSVMVGFEAGANADTGSNVTLIGYLADAVGLGTNIVNSIAIGANAKVAAPNTCVIGGTGTNAVKVSIGGQTAVNTLDVVGNISCSVITASLFNGTASYAATATTSATASYSNHFLIDYIEGTPQLMFKDGLELDTFNFATDGFGNLSIISTIGGSTATIINGGGLSSGVVEAATFASDTITGPGIAIWDSGILSISPTGSTLAYTSSCATTASYAPPQWGNITVIHSDGTTTVYTPTANTNTARGTSLKSAVTAGADQDAIYLSSNTYDIGFATLDLSGGGTKTLHLKGRSKSSSAIISSKLGYAVAVGINSEVADLTIQNTNTAVVSPCLGSNSGTISGSTIRNVNLIGMTDGMFFDNGCTVLGTVNVYNTDVSTNWDAFVWTPSNGKGTLNVYGSNISVVPTASVLVGTNPCDGFVAEGTNTANLFNCNFNIVGSGSNTAIGIYNLPSFGVPTVNVYGCVFATSGGSASYDIKHDVVSTSKLGLTSNNVFNVAKTAGPLSYLDTQQIYKSINNIVTSSISSSYILGSNVDGAVTAAATASYVTASVISVTNIVSPLMTVNTTSCSIDLKYSYVLCNTTSSVFVSSSFNRGAVKSATMYFPAITSSRNLSFNSSWVFLGTQPTTLAANKAGVLSITAFGSGESNIVAAWGVQV